MLRSAGSSSCAAQEHPRHDEGDVAVMSHTLEGLRRNELMNAADAGKHD